MTKRYRTTWKSGHGKIAISGLTGAGKTTLSQALGSALGWDVVSGSDIRRGVYGISETGRNVWFKDARVLSANKERISNKNSADRSVEERLVELTRSRQSFIFDTWFLPWVQKTNEMLCVYLSCSAEVRVQRVFGDTPPTMEQMELVASKDESSRQFGIYAYGSDIASDMSPFDLIVKTDELSLEDTQSAILEKANSFFRSEL